MKKVALITVIVLSVIVMAGCTAKDVPKSKAIIGEWEFSPMKSEAVEAVSNLKFTEDGNFMWLATNGTGTELIYGRYANGDQLTFWVGTDPPVKFDYSISGDVLKFDGLYYTRGKNLSFEETRQLTAAPGESKPVAASENTGSAKTEVDSGGELTKYDYKQFVDDTLKTFEPSAEISFSNYMEWDVDGTKYAKTTFKSKDLEHEFLMRFSTDTTQLFYASIDGQKVFSNVDAEMTYMDSQQ